MGTSSSGQDGISIFHSLPSINYNNKKTQTKFMKQLKKYSEKQKKRHWLRTLGHEDWRHRKFPIFLFGLPLDMSCRAWALERPTTTQKHQWSQVKRSQEKHAFSRQRTRRSTAQQDRNILTIPVLLQKRQQQKLWHPCLSSPGTTAQELWAEFCF